MNQTTFKLVFFLFFTCINAHLAFAQASHFSFEKYINNKNDTLNYRLLSPDYNPMRKYPLIIFLHGSGERGNDNEAQLKWSVLNFAKEQNMISHPAIVIAPQCPLNQGWSNFRETKNFNLPLSSMPTKPMELLIELIYESIKKLPVDTNRIYITGLSMGGFGTFDAIERYPNLFAAAVPVCGGGDTSKAALIAHIPIWIFASSEDPVVSPQHSIQMINALTKAGAKPGFTMYPEVGHFSWLGAFSDKLMIDWLFRQHK